MCVSGRRRLALLKSHFFHTGESPTEKRGGSRQTMEQKETRESIASYIKRFKVQPSHYGRAVSQRQYLSAELSMRKMWLAWKKERIRDNQPVCSLCTFQDVFRTRFNLAFGHPRTDVCSTCQKFDQAIDARGPDAQEQKLQKNLHLLRAQKFYKSLKESGSNPAVLCAAFDLQQNMPLPRTNVGEAYYKRQLWLYNFGVVIHRTKKKKQKSNSQNKRNIFLYSWLESDGGRGSNAICSAMTHFFRKIRKRSLRNRYTALHLYCDSCPGQNKNVSMLSLLLRYVNSKFCPFQRVLVTFPIPGHSYLPADRVFGRIEKLLRPHAEILTPAGYHSILQQQGQVFLYPSDWEMYDHKTVAESIITAAAMKIRTTRRWLFRKGSRKVKMSSTYGGPYEEYSPVKASVSLSGRKPRLVPRTSYVSAAKKKDVLALLQLVKGSAEDKKIYDTLLAHTKENMKDDFSTATELSKQMKTKKAAVHIGPQKRGHPQEGTTSIPSTSAAGIPKRRGRPRKTTGSIPS